MPKISKKKVRVVRRTRRGKRREASSGGKTVVQAPVVIGVQRQTGSKRQTNSKTAPYEQTYGEGDRYLVQCNCAKVEGRSGQPATAIFRGWSGSNTNSQLSSSMCSNLKGLYYSTSALVSTSSTSSVSTTNTVANAVNSVLASGSTANPLWNMLASHSRMTWRKLAVEYDPIVGTSTSVQLALAVVYQDYSSPSETTFESIMNLPGAISTPVWKPLKHTFILDKDLKRAALRTYPTEYDSSSTGYGEWQQFYVIGALSSVPDTSYVEHGRLIVHGIIDSYQLRGSQNVAYGTTLTMNQLLACADIVKKDYGTSKISVKDAAEADTVAQTYFKVSEVDKEMKDAKEEKKEQKEERKIRKN